MPELIVSQPDRNNQTIPLQVFRIEQTCDGDVWPFIEYLQFGEKPIRRECGGRLRLSGSGSFKLVMTMCKLFHHLEYDTERMVEDRQQDLIGSFPHSPKPFIERCMDDATAFLGLEIKQNGDVVISMRPVLDERGDSCTPGLKATAITIPAHTSYVRTYCGFGKLWRAIQADNLEIGDFHGYHA